MKQILRPFLFSFFMSVTLQVFCQDFPGKDVSLLMGKELRVKPKEKVLQAYGYDGFYKDEKHKKKFECCQAYNSKYASLVDKVFKIISIDPYGDDNIGSKKFNIKMTNAETGEIYYDYDPYLSALFPFEVVGGLTFPEGYYCQFVQEKIDKFRNETHYTTPEVDGISFMKVKKGSETSLYISSSVNGNTVNVGSQGIIILLENNLRIEKPSAKIDVKVNSRGDAYTYSAFEELTEQDIKLLTSNLMTDERLYIYDRTIKNAKQIIDYLKCIIAK